MKKTLLLLLTLCLVLCFAAFTASAEEETTAHEHCYCNGTVSGNDAHICESVTWTPISEALEKVNLTTQTADIGKLPSGNYYLDTDIKITGYSNIGSVTNVKNDAGTTIDRTYTVKEIAICLNGHTITTTKARTFGNLYHGSKLVISDCSGKDATGTWGGTVTGGTSTTGTIIYTYAGSTFEIYGGNFVHRTDLTATTYGLFCIACDTYKEADGVAGLTSADQYHETNRCFFRLFDGKFDGNFNGTATKAGATIAFWHNAQAYIYDGIIIGGKTTSSGGAFSIGGTATNVRIYGGTIKNGQATTSGDNIYISAGQLNIYGGSITGGAKTDIYQGGGTVTLDGAVTIGKYQSNVDSGLKLGENFSTTKIYVDSKKDYGYVVSSGLTLENIGCFEATVEGEKLVNLAGSGNADKLIAANPATAAKHYACYCGGAGIYLDSRVGHACTLYSTWVDLNAYLAEQNPTAGSTVTLATKDTRYYLSADLTIDYYLVFGSSDSKSDKIYLDLNGHTLTGASTLTEKGMVTVYNNFYLCDSSVDPTEEDYTKRYEGAIINTATRSRALMDCKTGALIRMFGGQLLNGYEGTGTGAIIGTNCIFNVFDGYIRGGKTSSNGATFLVTTSGDLRLYGGLIEGGETTKNGGNIYMEATSAKLIVNAGTISGGKAANGGNVYVHKGSVTIDGGTVTGGTATTNGGNIYLHAGSTVKADNTIDTQYEATLTMKKGTISDGTAGNAGGNVLVVASPRITNVNGDYQVYPLAATFTMNGGTVSGGTANYGGSIEVRGDMIMNGGTVTGGHSTTEGGNIRVYTTYYTDAEGNIVQVSTFTQNGGLITKGTSDGSSGNMHSYGITNLLGGAMTDGTAEKAGGNLRPFRPTVLTIGENYTISGGTSNTGSGGNIAMGGKESTTYSSYCTVTIKGTVTGGSALNSISDNIYSSDAYTILTIDGATITGGADTDLYFDGNSKLTLKGNATIGKLHLTNDSEQDVDASELTSTTPISLICDKAGAFASAETDKSACFVNDMGREITFKDGKLYIDNATVVYVSNNGKDTNAGTQAAPFKTINHALAMVKDEGTVNIIGVADVDVFTKHDKHITLTGGELNITNASRIELMDHIHFKNMTLTMPDGEFYFYCSGYTTVIDEDVTVRYLNKDAGTYSETNTTLSKSSALLAGTRTAYENTNGTISGTDLTVLSGTWGHIYGGNNNCVLNGDVHLTVGGSVNKNLEYATAGHSSSTNGYQRVFGGSRYLDSSVTINGTVYLNITGGKYNSVFGGSNGGAEGDTITAVEMKISGGEGMAAYGAGARIAHTIGTVNFYYEGGTFEQVFGGALSRALTGDVNMYVTGGKITRRLYGGCYNEVSSSGEWSNQYAVTGNINLYIGEGATISCDLSDPSATGLEAILTGGKYTDRGIYGHSRRGDATTSDAENATIIFLTKAAYDKHSKNLTAVDSIMAGIMRGVPCADLLYYRSWVAEGTRIAHEAVAVKDPGTNKTGDASAYTKAVSMALPGATVYYTGNALTPATLTVSDNWDYEAPVMTYADNTEIGTATVTLTAEGYTVTATFDIVKKAEVAVVGGTQYEYLQDAVNAVAEGGYMQILIDCDEPITISKDMYLDLNGHKLTGKVTVAEGATLYGVDSTTDNYDCTDGYGQITDVTGDVATQYKATVNGKIRRYLTYTDPETGAKSFHRIYLGVTSMSLRPSVSGVGYKATFRADHIAQSMLHEVEAFGYNLWLDGMETKLSCAKTRDELDNSKTVTLRIQGMPVDTYGETAVYANVYMKLSDGTTITSSDSFFTLRQMLEAIAADTSGYSEVQLTALSAMLAPYAEFLQNANWGAVANLLPQA